MPGVWRDNLQANFYCQIPRTKQNKERMSEGRVKELLARVLKQEDTALHASVCRWRRYAYIILMCVFHTMCWLRPKNWVSCSIMPPSKVCPQCQTVLRVVRVCLPTLTWDKTIPLLDTQVTTPPVAYPCVCVSPVAYKFDKAKCVNVPNMSSERSEQQSRICLVMP